MAQLRSRAFWSWPPHLRQAREHSGSGASSCCGFTAVVQPSVGTSAAPSSSVLLDPPSASIRPPGGALPSSTVCSCVPPTNKDWVARGWSLLNTPAQSAALCDELRREVGPGHGLDVNN